MDSQRNLLLIALLFVSFMLWRAWQADNALQQTAQISNIDVINTSSQVSPPSQPDKLIVVNTDNLSLTINTRGGDIEQAKLLDYPESLDSSLPFKILETSRSFTYQAQSGLTGKNGPDNPANSNARPIFQTEKDSYTLLNGENELRIPLRFIDKDGAIYTKTFVLKRNHYAVSVIYQIDNKSSIPIELTFFGQLKQTAELPKNRTNSNTFALNTFRGAAYSSSKEKYQKYAFDKHENLNIETQGGWIAMVQQYFATVWIPSTHSSNMFYAANHGNGLSTIGFKSTPVVVHPGAQKEFNATLWLGPELQDQMSQVAPHLELTVDYGWLWFISQPLFKLLKFIQGFIGNWGCSIIIITFIVRGIMYPLSKAQYTSLAKMRMMQPKIQNMRERIGNNKQRMSQEMMALYKSEKVNPLGGCLPLIIQMPIFLALYYMLIGSIELRHATFAFWINDLSAKDPYYILPILMGITMFCIQKMSPNTTTDPVQQKILTFMPGIFTVFFLWFPSGLVLYYSISNLVTIVQQKLIYSSLEKAGLYSRE